MEVSMRIWDWIIGKVHVIDELKPVISEGEAIVADLQELIKDIKSGNLSESADDAKAITQDLADFAAAVEKIVADLSAQK
jgi:hypothetical protein